MEIAKGTFENPLVTFFCPAKMIKLIAFHTLMEGNKVELSADRMRKILLKLQ